MVLSMTLGLLFSSLFDLCRARAALFVYICEFCYIIQKGSLELGESNGSMGVGGIVGYLLGPGL